MRGIIGQKTGIGLLCFSAILGLGGCVESRDYAPPFVINVQRAGDQCDVSVHGRTVADTELLQVARSSGTHRAIIVAGNIPYRCVGGAIITLQQAGFKHIDLAEWNPG